MSLKKASIQNSNLLQKKIKLYFLLTSITETCYRKANFIISWNKHGKKQHFVIDILLFIFINNDKIGCFENGGYFGVGGVDLGISIWQTKTWPFYLDNY